MGARALTRLKFLKGEGHLYSDKDRFWEPFLTDLKKWGLRFML